MLMTLLRSAHIWISILFAGNGLCERPAFPPVPRRHLSSACHGREHAGRQLRRHDRQPREWLARQGVANRPSKNSASRLFKKGQMRGARENRRTEAYLPIRCSEAIETCMRDVGSHCECPGTMVQIKAVVHRSHSNERRDVYTPGI